MESCVGSSASRIGAISVSGPVRIPPSAEATSSVAQQGLLVAEAHNVERGPQARTLRCVPRQAMGERIARANARGDRSARPCGIMGMARFDPQRLNQPDAKMRGPSSRR